MRTTVRLDDDLLRRAKQRAIETGTTLNALIEDSLRAGLSRQPSSKRDVFNPPVSGGGGTQPGVDLDDTATLADVMEGSG